MNITRRIHQTKSLKKKQSLYNKRSSRRPPHTPKPLRGGKNRRRFRRIRIKGDGTL